MAEFTPRLTVDGIYGSKYWYSSQNPFYPTYQMPNCTAYAWGRFWEISDIVPTLPTGNGGAWFPAVSSYETGQVPQLGAVACWKDPNGAGHVAIVEQILDNGDIITSNSGYYRPIASYPPNTKSYFWTETCYKDSGYRSSWEISRGYIFQGFIYNPNEPVPPQPTPATKKKGMPVWMMCKYF